MRKKLIDDSRPQTPAPEQDWLPVEDLAAIELTSEDAACPVESAFVGNGEPGWRAATPGKQVIRLVFDQPQKIRLIHLEFVEPVVERTQEYLLRWSSGKGEPFREIVRQQWNFNPSGTTRETENHEVDLPDVAMLELTINPDIGNRGGKASLRRWRIA
jgi:hypothetical protein